MDFEFKAPKVPGAGSSSLPRKRKAEDDLNTKGKQRATVTVSEEDEEEDPGQDDGSFAPGNDADYFAEEDEEGRFFGGGLSNTQKEILAIFDEGDEATGDGDDAQAMTVPSVRRQLLTLERAINKNSEMRVKWAGQPEKFVDSEVTLDSSIRELLLLTQNPRLFYPELIKLGIVNSLADLLSHENVDISIAVVQVLSEMTDDDVAEGDAAEDDEDEEAGPSGAAGGSTARAAVVNFADGLLKVQLLQLAINNLARMGNEEEEQERLGVYHTLSLIENLLALHPTLSETIAKETELIEWLLKRLQPPSKKEKGKEEDPALAQNRQYAAELLAIILQPVEHGRTARISFGAKGGIEVALKVLAQYRKRDPAGIEETEYMENVFDTLCSALSEADNKQIFLREEGVELMVIMMKEKMLSRTRAIKTLDHALSGDAGTEACERFVDVLGLKSLFAVFMNKDSGKKEKKAAQLTPEDEEHILSIMVALLSNLPSDSVPRVRMIKKFVEDEYAKTDRLVALRTSFLNRVRKREGELERERKMLADEGIEIDEVEEYLRRLEAGLYSLQLADYVLAWICMEDDGVRDHARAALERKGSSFTEVIGVLKEYQRNIGDSSTNTENTNGQAVDGEDLPADDGAKQRAIIGHLVDYLQGC